MKWEKKGLIYSPSFDGSWKDNSALQPTAILLKDKIRVFLCFRDKNGIGRIGYVDLDANNPSKILKISENPVLDIGEKGMFDDNGVAPTALIKIDNKIYLYYAGYQIPEKVRFIAFGGLAISENDGETFTRVSRTPIFERTEEAALFRVPHTVLLDDNLYKFWYGGGSSYIQGKNKTLPVYNIRYLETHNLLKIPDIGEIALDILNEEHRVGRPYVVKKGSLFKMYFGYGSDDKPYQLGYAESSNGKIWIRNDEKLNLPLSKEGWDSEMMAYPCVINFNSKTYIFYNGNEYGRYGFGYAELIQE